MGFWIYPDGYVAPTPPDPVLLTTAQRTWVKTQMQTYITNQNRPIYSVDLIDLAQDKIESQFNVLVSEDQLESICAEILSEWGTPGS